MKDQINTLKHYIKKIIETETERHTGCFACSTKSKQLKACVENLTAISIFCDIELYWLEGGGGTVAELQLNVQFLPNVKQKC